MANHASIPASRTQEQYDKAEMTLEDEPCPPQVARCPICRGQLLTAPERMKQLGLSRNDAQLWVCLVVKVKPNAVKNNIA